MKWIYGDSWERFPIQPGEIWRAGDLGTLAVHNLFDPLPAFMFTADLVFIDPPWNLGNLNTFYTKAGRSDYQTSFSCFADTIFQRIADIAPRTCYIEIGNQNADDFERRLVQQYPVVQRWPVTYYRKHPCWIIRGGQSRLKRDYSGVDEERVIADVGATEYYQVIGDFCMGRGLVGMAAYRAGNRFVGTELNPRRLAVLLDSLAKAGAQVNPIL